MYLHGGFVSMENDILCKIKSIGIIKIKMFDGIVQKLTEVRHMPELRKILILLGCLDAIGYKITLSSEVTKIVISVMVIMNGLET